MKRQALLFVAALQLTSSCASTQTEDAIVADENQLGIARFEIDRTDSEEGRVVVIRGTDDNGAEVGRATLRIGTVRYSMDPGSIPDVLVAGSELTVTVDDAHVEYTNPDRDSHQLAMPQNGSLAAFVALPEVATELAATGKLAFIAPHLDGEIAFAAGACSSSTFPTNKGPSTQCCRDGNLQYHKTATGLAQRSLGTACRTQAGTTGCTSNCWFGPCGAHIDTPVSGTSAATVFVPTSAPTVCGRDNNGSASGGTVQAPEAYNGTQTLWGGVSATCPFSACLAGGEPANTLNVTGHGFGWNSSGRVWAGGVLYFVVPSQGTASGSANFTTGNQIVQVSAQPDWGYAMIEGACNAIGGMNELISCEVEMSDLQNVTVTFSQDPM